MSTPDEQPRTPPTPPPCPAWCTEHAEHRQGWEHAPSATTKRCETRAFLDDIDGQPVTVTLERFAEVQDDGLAHVEQPLIRLEIAGRLDARRALRLAEAVISLVAATENQTKVA